MQKDKQEGESVMRFIVEQIYIANKIAVKNNRAKPFYI